MEKGWITFDLDETVMQNPFKKWVFPEIVRIFEAHLEDHQDILALIVEEHLRRMRDEKFLEAYDWDEIVHALIQELGVDAEIDVTALVKKHAVKPKVYVLEETMLDSLQCIKQHGYQLAAATNGYFKYQYPVLKELQLHTMFDEVIASDTSGFAKPDPMILQALQKKGKVVAHVGDRIDHDIVMANQLEITSVLIRKNLPEEVKGLPIDERSIHSVFRAFCEEKWQQENRLRNDPFDAILCLPDIVVDSIEELAENLDKLEK